MSWETNTGRSAREGWQGNVTAAMSASVNHGGANLHRFHEDQTQHLQSYTCFHGDELPRTGEPLLSLRRSIHSNGPNSLLPTAKLQDLSVGALYGSGYRNMQAKVKAADSVIQGMGSRLGPYTGRGVTLGGAMGNTLKTATGSPADSGVVYEYPTGTYTSKSGLPPLAYKPWSTEYVDEYRTPAPHDRALWHRGRAAHQPLPAPGLPALIQRAGEQLGEERADWTTPRVPGGGVLTCT
ncbi:uncharacterized protein HaLaN_23071 [Haematococcus lacustris]|uniref:Uncharacterized protein n=1 Tax=Haematococcus lacustris TaxID=44745 RepID=A0A699ZVE4_HAELA|nr:uncharacterized protein HaLaN_23071 [Haematococcus lacustris]